MHAERLRARMRGGGEDWREEYPVRPGGDGGLDLVPVMRGGEVKAAASARRAVSAVGLPRTGLARGMRYHHQMTSQPRQGSQRLEAGAAFGPGEMVVTEDEARAGRQCGDRALEPGIVARIGQQPE